MAQIILAEGLDCNFFILTSAFLSWKLIYCFSKDLITNTTKNNKVPGKQLQLQADKGGHSSKKALN